jgi:hypothetical protein
LSCSTGLDEKSDVGEIVLAEDVSGPWHLGARRYKGHREIGYVEGSRVPLGHNADHAAFSLEFAHAPPESIASAKSVVGWDRLENLGILGGHNHSHGGVVSGFDQFFQPDAGTDPNFDEGEKLSVSVQRNHKLAAFR